MGVRDSPVGQAVRVALPQMIPKLEERAAMAATGSIVVGVAAVPVAVYSACTTPKRLPLA
jgi:hypothetical protein